MGEWSDPVYVDQLGIDPDLFFDEDGTVYYTTSYDANGQGAYQSRIDIKSGERLSEVKLIWKGSGGQYPEGPHLYRVGSWYYLMISEGGTEYGHMVTVARSKSPQGPFEGCPHNPILSHRSLLKPVHATGHADWYSHQTAPGGRYSWGSDRLATRCTITLVVKRSRTGKLDVRGLSDDWRQWDYQR